MSNLPGRNYTANGSILLSVDVDTGSALDYSKSESSEYLKIVESNREVPSAVPDSVAYAGGGKSDPDSSVEATSSRSDESQAAQPKEPGAQTSDEATGLEASAQADAAESGGAADIVEASSAASNSGPAPEEPSGASGGADSGVEDVPQPVANEQDPN